MTTRCTIDTPVATRINAMTASAAARLMWSTPHGRSRAAEKIIAASAMSSTSRGAGGPGGTGCSARRSPSTTPTVSSVASRLNGAPPIGARLSCWAASVVSSLGDTRRCTAGMISRSGSSAGSATSVIRPLPNTAIRTIGILMSSDVAVLVDSAEPLVPGVFITGSDIALLFHAWGGRSPGCRRGGETRARRVIRRSGVPRRRRLRWGDRRRRWTPIDRRMLWSG